MASGAVVRDLFRAAKQPYTQALLGSMPKLGSKEPLYAIPGQPPNLAQLPDGCAFHPRCAHAMPQCAEQERMERYVAANWTARCWLLDQPAKEAYARAIASAAPGREILSRSQRRFVREKGLAGTDGKIDTSSAETGSSSTISRVLVASARAMATRWRCPPLNSCGNSRDASGSSPTSSNTSAPARPIPGGKIWCGSATVRR